MYWSLVNKNHPPIIGKYCAEYGGMQLPAWSLAALLGLMPITCILSISNGHYRIASNETNTFFHNNPIDAAFEIVCWLKENVKI